MTLVVFKSCSGWPQYLHPGLPVGSAEERTKNCLDRPDQVERQGHQLLHETHSTNWGLYTILITVVLLVAYIYTYIGSMVVIVPFPLSLCIVNDGVVSFSLSDCSKGSDSWEDSVPGAPRVPLPHWPVQGRRDAEDKVQRTGKQSGRFLYADREPPQWDAMPASLGT